ncbi:ergothioneine biosynthesis protein EgtB [Desertivirga xinjiangensis]|uniref:ergothioneine biosynthesis protein EgtB n=1 Tax=Desertivirga xinjiangensis TaxID=539206 RepID=UPI00210ABA9A|nr:ergothioneine biosynthesis protein EgtB [Pedobacter xinjiangensis]
MKYLEDYSRMRARTEALCEPLKIEDYVVQPMVDVSPPKWHLGHSTWFFETFLLIPHMKGYTVFNPSYNFVFNSYYETVGRRVVRTDRGNLSRPTVIEIYEYRRHVDRAMESFLLKAHDPGISEIIVLGINHEQQHQELLLTDIKYILGNNPLMPPYSSEQSESREKPSQNPSMIKQDEGVYKIGHSGLGFCFDNELGNHKVYLESFEISCSLVTNEEYMEFIQDGGYQDFRHWHSAGWEWVNTEKISAPMYWHQIDGQYHNYTLGGLVFVDPGKPVSHISYYEAAAFAAWKQMRLPSEFEWEAASSRFDWGERWEWTASAYLPYPRYQRSPGAIGEYNGKFMVGQQVLRGASVATPEGHSRCTYRNFFPHNARWQFTGIRLAK